MKTPSRRLVPLLVTVLVASCGRSEKKETLPIVQDTMLLHDLAQANRNTASADMDTTIPVTVRSRVDGGEQDVLAVGAGPGNASQILTPSGTTPRPRRPSNGPTGGSPSGDPCDSPAAEDQRTCLNRAIARSDVNLNRVYQELMAQARLSGGAELEDRFRDKQRAWIFTRDEACRRQAQGQDGTLWARERARCLADYSVRRTSELEGNLNSLRGR